MYNYVAYINKLAVKYSPYNAKFPKCGDNENSVSFEGYGLFLLFLFSWEKGFSIDNSGTGEPLHEQMISGEEMHRMITFMVSVMASNTVDYHQLITLEAMYSSVWFYYIVRLPVYVTVNSGVVAIVWHACKPNLYPNLSSSSHSACSPNSLLGRKPFSPIITKHCILLVNSRSSDSRLTRIVVA